METKRFIGNDMTRLYDRVKKEFGPDAIIVRTRSLLREGADPLIEVIAAPPAAAPELALDLQWKMVDGALGRLQIARPRATIGDLEDLAVREGPAPVRAQLAEPIDAQPAPEWFGGYVDQDDDEPPRAPQREPEVTEPRRHVRFGDLDTIPEVEAPSPTWASRPRPHMPPRRTAAEHRGEPGVVEMPARRARAATGLAGTLTAAGLSERAARVVADAAGANAEPEAALAAYLGSLDVRYPDGDHAALVTIQGPEGAGRTLALMRMALDCADAGREAVLIAADTTRAAAREQVHAYAEATALPVADAMEPSQLAGRLARAKRGACLFADVPAGPYTAPQTAGEHHYAYLALPAHWQEGALRRALATFDLERFSGVILTYADLSTDLSPALSVAIEAGMGVAFLCSSRDISTGIESVDPPVLASGILRGVTGVTTDGLVVASA
ncbi:MAG: hypothetical protein IT303_14710 [Dehalococcoidia bacterium]|nr:hypothetical protein [Dehalococcoidia bacterium]